MGFTHAFMCKSKTVTGTHENKVYVSVWITLIISSISTRTLEKIHNFYLCHKQNHSIFRLTSGAGRPPELWQVRVTGWPAVTLSAGGLRVGGSGGTYTVRRAWCDLIPGTPALALTWHWYTPSSESITGLILRLKSPGKTSLSVVKGVNWDFLKRCHRVSYPKVLVCLLA